MKNMTKLQVIIEQDRQKCREKVRFWTDKTRPIIAIMRVLCDVFSVDYSSENMIALLRCIKEI